MHQGSSFIRSSGLRLVLPMLCAMLSACGGEQEDEQGYVIAGSVSGLEAPQLTLQLGYWSTDNPYVSTERLVVSGGSRFEFATRLPAGHFYSILNTTTRTPLQQCDNSAAGDNEMPSHDVDIQVTCRNAYRVGGTVSGLRPGESLRLASPGLRTLLVDENGPFTFDDEFDQDHDQSLLPGESYDVTIDTAQPRCIRRNASGVITDHDVDTVRILCGDYLVEAQVTGLRGTGLGIRAEWSRPGEAADAITYAVPTDGRFILVDPTPAGTTYSLSVASQPVNPAQICTVNPSAGTLQSDALVAITCTDDTTEFPVRRWNMQLGYEGEPGFVLLAQSTAYPAWSNSAAGRHVADAGSLWPDFDATDDDIAHGEVYSGNRGKTYWVSAQAPHPAFAENNGSDELHVEYQQRQSYRKLSQDARLQLHITGLLLRTQDDANGMTSPPTEAPMFTQATLVASILAGTQQNETAESVGGHAINTLLTGRHSDWNAFSYLYDFQVNTRTLNLRDFFLYKLDADGDGVNNDAVVSLEHPVTVDLDLSAIAVGQEFTVEVSAHAIARDGPRGEETYAGAYLRDPASASGVASVGRSAAGDDDLLGLQVMTTELEATNRPFLGEATNPPLPAATCARDAAAGSGGTLQFSAASFSTPELPRSAQAVLVTRTGGTSGVVDVMLSTADGTASAGTDYKSIARRIRFNDGDDYPRLIDLRLVADSDVEPDETLVLKLSDPEGCAVLGSNDTAERTHSNDDVAPPQSYTIGGSINGLGGSGFTIRNGSDTLNIASGSDTFQFPSPLTEGTPYAVRIVTQPSNPAQVCSVANGEGTMGGADVTNVVISCTDPPPPPAGLDLTFGTGGKVYAPLLVDDAIAMGLQSDGGIVIASRDKVTRYTASGVLDATFGTAGIATLPWGGISGVDRIYDLAIQADDRIVVVGSTRTSGNAPENFQTMRLQPNGALDMTFGVDGKVITDVLGGADFAQAVTIQNDGKIVVAGRASVSSPINFEVAIARYLPTGVLDSSWGGDGLVTTGTYRMGDTNRTPLLDAATAITMIGDTVLIAGVSSDMMLLARYAPNGDLHPTLTGQHAICDGIPDPPPGYLGWVHVSNVPGDAIPKAIVATDRFYTAIDMWNDSVDRFGLLATFDTGWPDSECEPPPPELPYRGFDLDGLASVTAATPIYASGVHDMALAPDGKLVLVGDDLNYSPPLSTLKDFLVTRFRTQDDPATNDDDIERGTLDPAFGNGGVLAVDFFGSGDSARAVAIQSDGKIVVAGLATNGTTRGLGIARINP